VSRIDTGAIDLNSRDEEASLVARLRMGDSVAIEELYARYHDRLYAVVADHLNGNREMAEDVVGEVFLAALSSLDRFRGDSQIYTWLCSIAFHKIGDLYRRQAKESTADRVFPYSEDPDIDTIRAKRSGTDQPSAPGAMEEQEARHAVRQLLGGLPRDYRRVLVLKYIDDRSVQEIGRLMGRSPKSIEGLLSRARKAMRANLVEAGR